MFELVVEDTFDAAHKIIGHAGKCNKLHGHTWKVRIFVQVHELSINKLGITIDFRELKEVLKHHLAPFDHEHLNTILPEDMNPSAENIALTLFKFMKKDIELLGGALTAIMVYETPSTGVGYYA